MNYQLQLGKQLENAIETLQFVKPCPQITRVIIILFTKNVKIHDKNT